jgi:predicted phage tail protein
MSDKMVDSFAAVGRAQSMFSLAVGLLISIVFFIIGLVFVFKGTYSGGLIMMGVALLIGGISYVSHHMVSTNSTYAAWQGASTIFGNNRGRSGRSSGGLSIGPIRISN